MCYMHDAIIIAHILVHKVGGPVNSRVLEVHVELGEFVLLGHEDKHFVHGWHACDGTATARHFVGGVEVQLVLDLEFLHMLVMHAQ